MKYIIMLTIVIGLALADFATGWIKAFCKGDVRSSKMRKGGLMEVVSILENYGEINPQASWINKIVAKFGVFKDKED